MLWPMLVIATLTSIAVAIVCFAAGVRQVSLLFPIQVLVSFVVTYSIASHISDTDETALLIHSGVVALSFPLAWLMLRLILGPLQRRRKLRSDSNASEYNAVTRKV